jgi:hypothetical protein
VFTKVAVTHEILYPVAISDKDLRRDPSFTVRTLELCTICGACFGIGYQGAHDHDAEPTDEIEELPGRLTEILAKDHLHNRAHKSLIDLTM